MRDRLIELLLKCEKENDVLSCYNERPKKIQAAEIIADYLLANGVVVPPCKVGYKIYQTDGNRIYESTIGEVTYTTDKTIYVTENIAFDETAIGKSIFLSRKEAELKLKEGAK